MTNGNDGLLKSLRVADLWLWYDTSPEAADRRSLFRVATRKIENSLLDDTVHHAARIARTVLADADPVWLKSFRLEPR